ncbi:MAG: FecCD family ABC transporter permease, partial [Thermodesulfobacteriota bacterium]
MSYKNSRSIILIPICILFVVLLLCICTGSINIPPKDTVFILLNKLGFNFGIEAKESYELIVLNIRLPRVLLATVVGGGLAIVGVVMQAIFKNPMAEPGVLGWSNGGALFAVIVIYTGLAQKSLLVLPVAAFSGTLLTAFIVYKVSLYKGVVENTTLLLSGIAIGLMFIALTT